MIVRLSLAAAGPLVRSIVPALVTVTSWPGVKGAIACTPFPAKTVLVASIDSVPVPVPASPSVSVLAKVGCELLVSSNSSQLIKRATPVALVLFQVSRSMPGPPSMMAVGTIFAAVRPVKTATSLPAPSRKPVSSTPPPVQFTVSAPVPLSRKPPTLPPEMVKTLSPLPKLTKPPMRPPDRLSVSLFWAARTLVTINPPDMVSTLLASVMSIEPIWPPVTVTKSPSFSPPVMTPPDTVAKSSSPPWLTLLLIVPPAITKRSTPSPRPLPWSTVPFTRPPRMMKVSAPLPWLTLPLMVPELSMMSGAFPVLTISPLIVPVARLLTVLSPLPAKVIAGPVPPWICAAAPPTPLLMVMV